MSSTSWTTNDNTMSRSKTFEESSRRQSWKKETEDFEDEMRSRAKVSIQKAENKLKLEALSDASKRFFFIFFKKKIYYFFIIFFISFIFLFLGTTTTATSASR